jgi:Fe-S-cluster containining protein
MSEQISPMDRSYFFDAGIRFECQRCGACCCGSPGTVYVSAGEMVAIAGLLGCSVEALIEGYLSPLRDSFTIREHPDGRCLFYENGCTIYTVRPKQCRTFPFWFGNLRSEPRWNAVARECPGIGTGRLFYKDEIIARVTESLDS